MFTVAKLQLQKLQLQKLTVGYYDTLDILHNQNAFREASKAFFSFRGLPSFPDPLWRPAIPGSAIGCVPNQMSYAERLRCLRCARNASLRRVALFMSRLPYFSTHYRPCYRPRFQLRDGLRNAAREILTVYRNKSSSLSRTLSQTPNLSTSSYFSPRNVDRRKCCQLKLRSRGINRCRSAPRAACYVIFAAFATTRPKGQRNIAYHTYTG